MRHHCCSNLPMNKSNRGLQKPEASSAAFHRRGPHRHGYMPENGVTVCNCAGYSTVAVADLVFWHMVISPVQKYHPLQCSRQERRDKKTAWLVLNRGQKFGIVGHGAIGLRTAKIARAFGCEVYAYSRTVKEIEGVTYVP